MLQLEPIEGELDVPITNSTGDALLPPDPFTPDGGLAATAAAAAAAVAAATGAATPAVHGSSSSADRVGSSTAAPGANTTSSSSQPTTSNSTSKPQLRLIPTISTGSTSPFSAASTGAVGGTSASRIVTKAVGNSVSNVPVGLIQPGSPRPECRVGPPAQRFLETTTPPLSRAGSSGSNGGGNGGSNGGSNGSSGGSTPNVSAQFNACFVRQASQPSAADAGPRSAATTAAAAGVSQGAVKPRGVTFAEPVGSSSSSGGGTAASGQRGLPGRGGISAAGTAAAKTAAGAAAAAEAADSSTGGDQKKRGKGLFGRWRR